MIDLKEMCAIVTRRLLGIIARLHHLVVSIARRRHLLVLLMLIMVPRVYIAVLHRHRLQHGAAIIAHHRRLHVTWYQRLAMDLCR